MVIGLSARTAWMRPGSAWVRRRLKGTTRAIHRRVLGGGSDVSMHGQVGQARFDLGFDGEAVVARPQAVEADEAYDPRHLGTLGMNGVAVQTEHLSHVVEA
jgi:hypothetical protein